MTAIAKRKTVMRGETETRIQHRSLIVEIRAYTVFIRQKGRRIGYEVSWESVFTLGATKEAERKRAERKAARKAIRGKG